MKVSPMMDFVCPMDGLALAKEGASLRCEKGHTYDFAKEGYCNLLLVQQKGSADPGDNKEMVAARARFLESGHYQAIAEKSFDFVLLLALEGSFQGNKTFRVVDAGCGEGYYLNRFAEFAEDSANPARLEICGFDISKWAVKAAAKRSKKISWVVASNRQMPFAPESVDLILSMFGFPIWESFKAVQPSGGLVLLVDPGPLHLKEMREVIYPKVNETSAPALEGGSGYSLEREESLQYSILLKNQREIQDLLAMTPHSYRIAAKGREALANLDQLEVTIDLVFRLLRR